MRYRVFFYTSFDELEEGSATMSRMVDGEAQLGSVIAKFADEHTGSVIVEIVSNPRY
jgi:hypothetical protein